MRTRTSLTPIRRGLGAVAAAAVVTMTASVAAAQPRISNGTVNSQPAGALAATFRSLVAARSDAAWIGYTVPVVDGERVMCCFGGDTTWVNGTVVSSDAQSCCRACRLEPAADGVSIAKRAPAAGGPAIKLSGSERMVVLFRVVGREVERIRTFSEDCALDAGGRQVTWLENVQAADSIALLESYATSTPAATPSASSTSTAAAVSRLADAAVSAIALHGDAAADASLGRLVAPTQPEALRKKVTFWLGNTRRGPGLALLQKLLAGDPSQEVRKGAIFGLSQSHEAGAFDALVAVARNDTNPRLRGEALFWLGHKNDPRATKEILAAIERDPAAEVRKRGVMALNQLRDDTGVDALVQLARTSTDATTRGEAVFWLGQKAGQRAAAAITEAIEKDPDTEVKKRAVFALSQMPKDQGVPLLINVARTHANPAVRKQAIFWLGQSRDPRATEFFAEILK